MKYLIEDSNKIDLHIHTEYSDGDYTVEELLENAKELNLKYISFTDHNIDEARFSFNKKLILDKYGIKIIPGCELDVNFRGARVHLLAYNYNSLFNILFLYKLEEDFFNGKVSLKKACKAIHLCGGKAILAHPFKYKKYTHEVLEAIISEGNIDGIECIHPYHSQNETDYLLELCNKNNLIVTAGSDFHYDERKIRNNLVQNSLCELPVTNSTIEAQLKRAKQKYASNSR